jgi:hypothetical protein
VKGETISAQLIGLREAKGKMGRVVSAHMARQLDIVDKEGVENKRFVSQ